MVAVSVIVVVYNAKTYISSCIHRILNQTLPHFEVILVDDGSSDGTGLICDEFARQDARIRVFHNNHQGVAYARQVGIEHARGEYTIHVDADDEIEPAMLEKTYQAAEKERADMLICDYKEKNRDGEVYHCQRPTRLDAKAVLNDLVDGKLYGSLWNKLIRTSCYREHDVSFRQALTMREDMFFIFDVMPYVESIAYLPKAFYTYDRTGNANSLTNTYLVENRHYYDQEILWHQVALENALVGDAQKVRLRNALMNDAYITLSGHFFSKEEWQQQFSCYLQHIEEASPFYKRWLVIRALNGHYRFSSNIRKLIAKIKSSI